MLVMTKCHPWRVALLTWEEWGVLTAVEAGELCARPHPSLAFIPRAMWTQRSVTTAWYSTASIGVMTTLARSPRRSTVNTVLDWMFYAKECQETPIYAKECQGIQIKKRATLGHSGTSFSQSCCMQDGEDFVPFPEVSIAAHKLTLAPLGGGGPKGLPCGFSQIAPEVLRISLWNLPYLSGQQFHTLCQKIRTQVIIGQPWVTSEWHHVSPILINKMGLQESPPLVQF